MKKRFTEEQIIGFLREVGSGVPVKELCRRHGFSGDVGERSGTRGALKKEVKAPARREAVRVLVGVN